MRTLFLLLTIFAPLGTLAAQRTPNDTIDFNNFDTTLFVQCFVDLCNQERVDLGGKNLKISDEGKLAAQFQVSYIVETGKMEHFQSQTFKGLNLKTPKDRLEYFSKEKHYYSFGEILCSSPFKNKITYKSIAKKVFRQYFLSPGHKAVIMDNLTKQVKISYGVYFYKDKEYTHYYTCFLFI